MTIYTLQFAEYIHKIIMIFYKNSLIDILSNVKFIISIRQIWLLIKTIDMIECNLRWMMEVDSTEVSEWTYINYRFS